MSDSHLTSKQAKRIHRKENPGLTFKEWVRQNKKVLYEDFATFDEALTNILKVEPKGTKPDEKLRRQPKTKTPEPHALGAAMVRSLHAHNTVSDTELLEYLVDKYIPGADGDELDPAIRSSLDAGDSIPVPHEDEANPVSPSVAAELVQGILDSPLPEDTMIHPDTRIVVPELPPKEPPHVTDIWEFSPSYRKKSVGLDDLCLRTISYSDDARENQLIMKDADGRESTLLVTERQLQGIVGMIKQRLKWPG